MGSEHPVLVHVAGPQKGQHTILKYPLAVAGRSPTAQVILKEEFISRQHMKFEKTPDGCIVENLSSSGTFINGKKYKMGKKVILGTGDVLAIGQQTKILFVESGGDVQEALDVYWRKNPGDQPLPTPAVPVEVTAPATGATPVPAEGTPLPAEVPLEPILVTSVDSPPTETISPEEQEQIAQAAARKAKLRKYVILGGVYLVLMVGVVFLLQSLKKENKPEISGLPVNLSPKKIGEILNTPLKRLPNASEAQKFLQLARSRYENRRILPGDLYLCFKDFKLFLAYNAKPVLPFAEDEKKFTDARDELKALVIDRYDQAVLQEHNRDWKKAKQILEELLKIIPDREPHDPVYEGLVRNIFEHQKFINPYLPKR